MRGGFVAGLLVAAHGAGWDSAWGQAPTDIAALCGSRSPCALVKATPAGADAQGRALTVVELDLGKKNPENTSGDRRFDCNPYRREFWLRTEGVAPARRILALCNDGYGAAGVGEDEVKIGANRLEHARNGGSAWRWDNARTIELAPLRVLAEESCSYHNVNIGYSITRWDWLRFAGERRWFPPACKDDDPRAEKRPDWCDAKAATHRHALIPRLDGALPAGAAAHLGSCASAFDESGQRGFVVFGNPRPRGAEFRVLLVSNRDLVVTVSDDAFAAGAASWLHDDHIELWIGPDRSGLSCSFPDRIKLSQLGIGLDGKVHHGAGDRAAAPVVVARAALTIAGRQQVTLRLRLPPAADFLRALTVVYSKSEGGKQARLTATSPIRRGDAATLSGVFKVEAQAARCAVRDGQLDLVETGRPALLEQ
jgi:hypothetical protein